MGVAKVNIKSCVVAPQSVRPTDRRVTDFLVGAGDIGTIHRHARSHDQVAKKTDGSGFKIEDRHGTECGRGRIIGGGCGVGVGPRIGRVSDIGARKSNEGPFNRDGEQADDEQS
jgi:hypothetical protein